MDCKLLTRQEKLRSLCSKKIRRPTAISDVIGDANIYLLSLKTFENWNPSNGQNWWVLLAVTYGPRDQIIDEGNPRRGKTAELWPDFVWRATKTNYPAEMTTGKKSGAVLQFVQILPKILCWRCISVMHRLGTLWDFSPGARWRQAVMHCSDHRSDTKLIYIKPGFNHGMAMALQKWKIHAYLYKGV